jgi:hypothetical protein
VRSTRLPAYAGKALVILSGLVRAVRGTAMAGCSSLEQLSVSPPQELIAALGFSILPVQEWSHEEVFTLVLLACAATSSAPAVAAAGPGTSANCIGVYASTASGMPPFVSLLMAGFVRILGIAASNNCDVPGG